ncbi:MAG: hypothetical protein FJX72_17635 [Armatimonadetes bacterium]|nr:hypothetical protein [Armatimonadota bacterium]
MHEISAADVGPDLPWIEPWEVLPMDADKDGVRDDGFYVSTVIGLARLGADGSLQWVRTSSAEDEAEWAEQIVARPAGGFVVAGTAVSMDSRFKTGSRWDAWLLGLTQSGDVDWQALYGPHEHSWATSVVQMPDGYLFALNAGAGACILRLAEDGSEQWQHCYGREEDGFVVQRIATAPDGAIFVAGSSYELTIVQRLQADGSPDPAWSPWERVYATGTDDEEDDEGPASVSSLSLELLPDGGYLLGIEQLRGDILHVARIDPDGNPAWGWSIPRWYSHGRSPVLASPDGGAYIAWPTGATGPRKCSVAHQYDCPDLSLAHIDPTGTVVWQQTYATGMPDFPTAMVRASDCGLLVAGQTRGIAYPAWDAWLVKVGADGMISPSCPAWRSLDEPVYVIAGLLTRVSAAETSAPVPRPDLERVDASFMSQALTPVVTRSCYGEAPGRDPCGPPGARSGLDLAQLEDAVAEDTGSADAAADGSQDVPYVKDTGECVDAPADFNGIWEVHFTCKNSCGPQPVQSGVDMATVTQVGDFANIQEEMGSFVGHGHICGNEFSWSGSGMGYSESGTWFMHKDGSITKESHWQSDSELACGGDCTGDIYPSSEKP